MLCIEVWASSERIKHKCKQTIGLELRIITITRHFFRMKSVECLWKNNLIALKTESVDSVDSIFGTQKNIVGAYDFSLKCIVAQNVGSGESFLAMNSISRTTLKIFHSCICSTVRVRIFCTKNPNSRAWAKGIHEFCHTFCLISLYCMYGAVRW